MAADFTNSARDDARRLAALILLRALVASALFGTALLTSFGSASEETGSPSRLFLYLASVYVSSAVEFVWVLVGRQMTRLALIHAGIEVALAAWLVALTGGIESPFVFLLLIATVLGAVAAGSRGAFVAATLSTAPSLRWGAGSPSPGWPTSTAG